jgi:hypothetical protein
VGRELQREGTACAAAAGVDGVRQSWVVTVERGGVVEVGTGKVENNCDDSATAHTVEWSGKERSARPHAPDRPRRPLPQT